MRNPQAGVAKPKPRWRPPNALRTLGGRAGYAGPRGRTSRQARRPNGSAAPLTGPVAGPVEPPEGGVNIGQLAAGLVDKGRDVLSLECVGRAFWIMLVVPGRRSHDPVEVAGERPEPSLGSLARGGQPGARG